ncbi:MAG: S8 family serine peptidase, partial [Chloroflexi bacterium]|nr:S8 family serine peptidase [Chloroflexota bacterium]
MSKYPRKSKIRITLLTLILTMLLVGSAVLLAGAAPAWVIDSADAVPNVAADTVAERAPKTSHRLIVQLASPSLAEQSAQEGLWRTENGRLDANAPEAQAYIAQLEAEQKAFVAQMNTALPELSTASYINEQGQSIQAAYQVVLNGVAVDASGMGNIELARRELGKLPGVQAVHLDYAHYPETYTSTQLINAPVLWNMAGGQDIAGAGVKLASMDGGLHHDAAMFDGTGWSYPGGWPAGGLGDAANNNGKIIASRAYFRDWDPPAVGDENSWPGVAGTSHGTHTGSTAAGNATTQNYLGVPVNVTGVAPGAWLMSYRVFYASVTDDGNFYTVEGIAALEDLTADGADVVNNSWGGGPGSVGAPFDPLDQALLNASAAGVFVSMPAGNAGPGNGTTDHPSSDYINVAASTTAGTYASGQVNITAPAPVISPELSTIPFAAASFGAQLSLGVTLPYTTFVTGASVDPGNFEGCNAWVGTPFTGTTAFISRGACEFGVKVLNAENAGADFVVIYNHAAGGDGLINMAPGAVGNSVTIPSIFIGHTSGTAIVSWYATNGAASAMSVDTIAYQAGNTPDQIIAFSSRGPGVGNVLKPDIAAPGVNIMAQGYDPSATGEARHLGIGQASGTSMASPHVAGSAALLRQLHPTWTNAQIKSALMSTSQYMDIYNFDGSPAQPLDMGAGRLDLTNAADPGVILDPPSLSFGLVPTGTMQTISVTITNITTATETYDLSTLYTGNGFTMTTALPGVSVSPISVTLAGGDSAAVQVTFDSMTGQGLGDNQGYIILAGNNGHDAHMPAWARVLDTPAAAEVLIIDNDASFTLGNPDYLSYYTETLTALGITYDVFDADAEVFNGFPSDFLDMNMLMQYGKILYFTGDNYEPDGTYGVPTPLSAGDMDGLVEYVNSGGILIAMGQDMTSVMADSFFQESVLGVPDPLQDSVTGFSLPDAAVVAQADAPPAFAGVNLDLSGPEVNSVTLTGANEVPPVATTMIGTADFGYDNANQVLDYDVTV